MLISEKLKKELKLVVKYETGLGCKLSVRTKKKLSLP